MFFFLKRQTFTYFLLTLCVVAGLYSVNAIRKESFPEIEIPIVGIQTVFPGASATDVEELVTDTIEEQLLRTLTGVEKITSTSRDSISSVFVEFNTSKEIGEGLQEVKDEVDLIISDLPDDVVEPQIAEVSFSDEPVLIVSVSSQSVLTQLSETVERIEDTLLGIRGVSEVDVAGLPEREISVILEPDALSRFALNPTDVVVGIARSNASLPIGEIVQSGIRYNLTFDGDFASVADVANTVVAETRGGEPIYVRDLGIIEDGLAVFESRSRLSIDGSVPQQAVTFFVKKQVGADVTEVTAAAREALTELQDEFAGEQLEFVTLIDLGEQVFSDLKTLSSAGIQTVLLVFIAMIIGLGYRESVLGALAIPISFVIAFAGLLITGNTLNFVSLFSLILVIGILVDAAVVITEGISDNMQKGYAPNEAAERTIKEFASPVIAGTATTVVVFIPLLFLSGVTGQFIASIPATVIIVLLASLFVALVFIPVIATKLLKVKKQNEGGRLRATRARTVERMRRRYRNMLEYMFVRKWIGRTLVGGIIGLLLVSFSFVGLGLIKSEFFPADNFDQLSVSVSLPPGYTLDQTSERVVAVEEVLRREAEIKAFVTTVRSGGTADINVIINDDRLGQAMVNKLRNAFAGDFGVLDITVAPPENGPSAGAPFSVKFVGENLIELSGIVQQAARLVEDIPGTRDVSTSVDDNSIDISFVANREQIERVGLDVASVAQIVRVALFGGDATSFKHPVSNEDVDVAVKVGLNPNYTSTNNTNHITVDTLRTLPIQTPQGEVLLGSLMQERIVESTPSIEHEDGKRIARVSSFVADGFVVNDINTAFLVKMDGSITLPPGVEMSFGGDTEATAESGQEMLLALLAGVLLVFAVLVFQFNSIKKTFFVVSVIPFGLVGVLFGLFIFNQTLSFSAMLGFVALVGIVINNSIILIDVMQTLQKEGLSHIEVVLTGASSRLRPILLTTITTVLGMVPLLITSPFWMPLALAIICGLLFAVILTLFVIPLLYYWWGKT